MMWTPVIGLTSAQSFLERGCGSKQGSGVAIQVGIKHGRWQPEDIRGGRPPGRPEAAVAG